MIVQIARLHQLACPIVKALNAGLPGLSVADCAGVGETIALLVALYMVKPSPFCLLDELDAPLDESNIGRFTELLKKFVNESQFIIITHNKRTVAAANAIYGVTMEERGVSKTVSMRFNQERGEPEAQALNLAEAVSGARAPTATPVTA